MKKNYHLLLRRPVDFLWPTKCNNKAVKDFNFFKKCSLVLAIWLFILSSATLFAQNGETCATAINITELTSPINGTTLGATHDYSLSCSGLSTAPDLFYSITVPNGYTLNIGLTACDYYSAHDIFFGGCQAGDQTAIYCTETNLEETVWENTTGATQTVYWVQDGIRFNVGTFTLEWLLTPPPACSIPRSPTVLLTSPTVANVSWDQPLTGSPTGYEYAITTAATPPSNGIGTANLFATNVPVTVNVISYLHVRANCGTNGYSNWVTYTFNSGFCRPVTEYAGGRGITNVAMGSIYNSTGTEAGNYADYAAQIVNVGQGNTQPFSITLNADYNVYNMKIWVDWNNDYDFEDEGEEV